VVESKGQENTMTVVSLGKFVVSNRKERRCIYWEIKVLKKREEKD
jgi:hypothetical protein